ncbi:hypothetical protein H0H93_014420 [Arthromyces matolae]|nr:hypothetical protein H0H93_014420 [Arthromyces matolae]
MESQGNAMTSIETPQGFVRALKASSDPLEDGQSKIEIARQVWDNTSFHVPNKTEVIVDWILSKFLKDKDKEIALNPLLDQRYWTLLKDALTAESSSGSQTRPLKTWLPPLLTRIPFVPSVVSFFHLIRGVEPTTRHTLNPIAFSFLASIWPTLSQKLNSESLLDIFGSFLTLYANIPDADESFMRTGSLIAKSFRNSLLNTSNKKKVYLLFLQSYVSSWLELVAHTPSDLFLFDTIYDTGIDTLFNLDILRRARDSKAEDELFTTVASVLDQNPVVYTLLPRLFSSYVDCIKKYRGALISQGSNQTPGLVNGEIQSLGIGFLASCLQLLDRPEESARTWTVRVGLLEVVDKESLFDRRNPEAAMLLERVVEHALQSLDIRPRNFAHHGIECLSTLARIDYDMVVPLVPRVLPKFLLLPGPNDSYLNFLDLILSYHTKTRTVDTYAEDLLNTSSSIETVASLDPGELYKQVLSSSFLDDIHLRRLSKALHTSMSESQVLSLVHATFDCLKRSEDKPSLHADDISEERSSKRRKTKENGTQDQPQSLRAIAFCVASVIGMTIFSSVPTHVLTAEMKLQLSSILSSIRAFSQRSVRKLMKILDNSDNDHAWSHSIVAVSSLRLWYTFDITRHLPLPPFDDEKLCTRGLNALQKETLQPELRIELVRVPDLYGSLVDVSRTSSRLTMDSALVYMEKNLPTKGVCQPYPLTLDVPGQREAALALMHMLVGRWLPVVETFASEEQLTKLVQLLMSMLDPSEAERQVSNGLTPQTLLLQTLQTAQFWELPKIRGVLAIQSFDTNLLFTHLVVFLNYIDQAISAHRYTIDTDVALLSSGVSVYRLLLSFPVHYLSRSNRGVFTRKALTLDRCVTGSSLLLPTKFEHLNILRVFLNRILSIPDGVDFTVEDLVDVSKHLTAPANFMIGDILGKTTATLLESVFCELFKKLKHTHSEIVLDLFSYFPQIATDAGQQTMEHSTRGVISMLTSAMKHLYQVLSATIRPLISALESNMASIEEIRAHTHLLELWHCLLCFCKWLGQTENTQMRVGAQLFLRLSSWGGDAPERDNMLVAVLEILLEEFSFCPDTDRLANLDLIMATYSSAFYSFEPPAQQQIECSMSRLCSTLSTTEYTHILELVAEELKCNRSVEARTHLVKLAATLLHGHPQGTLKLMQTFFTRCVQIFINWRDLLNGPVELRLRMLEFVAHHCNEQPAVLRNVDMGSIWGLLALLLSGSPTHDQNTTLKIFHEIISIVSALIRLRRDLVVHTLPHLGSILRQLLMIPRTVRPNLGTKQSALVTDTLPQWLNPKQPVGVEEVKALARLLETLTVKTVVRNNAPNTETQKAESLAKPFSKHAVYVVKAYVTAMNDPLCLLPSEHRKELQRGLFALCSMISDHNRDAMMVSTLDAGGKLTMKSLWKEYEKQRYVGKG